MGINFQEGLTHSRFFGLWETQDLLVNQITLKTKKDETTTSERRLYRFTSFRETSWIGYALEWIGVTKKVQAPGNSDSPPKSYYVYKSEYADLMPYIYLLKQSIKDGKPKLPDDDTLKGMLKGVKENCQMRSANMTYNLTKDFDNIETIITPKKTKQETEVEEFDEDEDVFSGEGFEQWEKKMLEQTDTQPIKSNQITRKDAQRSIDAFKRKFLDNPKEPKYRLIKHLIKSDPNKKGSFNSYIKMYSGNPNNNSDLTSLASGGWGFRSDDRNFLDDPKLFSLYMKEPGAQEFIIRTAIMLSKDGEFLEQVINNRSNIFDDPFDDAANFIFNENPTSSITIDEERETSETGLHDESLLPTEHQELDDYLEFEESESELQYSPQQVQKAIDTYIEKLSKLSTENMKDHLTKILINNDRFKAVIKYALWKGKSIYDLWKTEETASINTNTIHDSFNLGKYYTLEPGQRQEIFRKAVLLIDIENLSTVLNESSGDNPIINEYKKVANEIMGVSE